MAEIKKSLSPQAAEYYKRLLLISDRYYLLTRKKNVITTMFWLVSVVAIVEAVFIATKIL